MKRKIIKISVIVLSLVLLIFTARYCVLSIMRSGTKIPSYNTPLLKNLKSFNYMVDVAKYIYDSESKDVVVTKIAITFFAHEETIDVDVYGESNKEIRTYYIKLTPEILEKYKSVCNVFGEWNLEFRRIVVCDGQVNFYAEEAPYALIYREDGNSPTELVTGIAVDNFYTERIFFNWFHSYIKD